MKPMRFRWKTLVIISGSIFLSEIGMALGVATWVRYLVAGLWGLGVAICIPTRVEVRR